MVAKEVIDGLSYNEKKLLLALAKAGGSAAPEDLVRGGAFSLGVEAMGAASRLSFNR